MNETVRERWLALLLALMTAVVYWPGIHGFWGRDDFIQLAYARLLGSPWPLFSHDHFPVAGAVFRPLGFASMWFTTQLLGTDYTANAIADLSLHAAVVMSLFFVMRQARVAQLLAFLASLVFAVQPAVLGTALWWSARFDLLASLGVFLALQAAFAYRRQSRPWWLAATLVATLGAMLSKEIGLAAVVALGLLWMRWSALESIARARARLALFLTMLVGMAFLVWRAIALGTLSSGVSGTLPLTRAIAKGVFDWCAQAPGYWTFWIRLDPVQQLAVTAASLMLALGVALSVVHGCRSAARIKQAESPLRDESLRAEVDLAICGASLLLLPALLQSPVAAVNAAAISLGASAVETAMQSRLYYLGIGGGVMLLAALLAMAWRRSPSYVRGVMALALLTLGLAFGTSAHQLAHAFARRTTETSVIARSAVDAVQRLDLPASHCHVVLFDVDPPAEWSVFVSMDSIIKALTPDLARVGNCYFHTNYTTYAFLLKQPADPADAAPYPLRKGYETAPWRVIGNLVITRPWPVTMLYTDDLAGMQFLRYRGGRFEDVNAAVRSGDIHLVPH